MSKAKRLPETIFVAREVAGDYDWLNAQEDVELLAELGMPKRVGVYSLAREVNVLAEVKTKDV